MTELVTSGSVGGMESNDCLYPDGIEREATIVVPFAHRLGIVGVEPSAADEPAQHAPADAGLNRGDIGLAQVGQLAGAKLPVHEVEQRIDDAAMKVDMFVERIAETVDETDGAEMGVPWCIGATFDQLLLNHPQQDVQNRTDRRRIRLEEVTQTFRQRQHPLAHRQGRKHMIDEMRGGLRHAPSIAGRTNAASFAGEGDEKVTTAIRAVGTGEAISEDAAFQVPSEVPFDRCPPWKRAARGG